MKNNIPFPSPFKTADKASLYPYLLVKNVGENIFVFFPLLESLNFSLK